MVIHQFLWYQPMKIGLRLNIMIFMTVEERIAEEVKKSGMKKIAICQKTGLKKGVVYPSLAGKRELRAEEFLAICQLLHLDPMEMATGEMKGA